MSCADCTHMNWGRPLAEGQVCAPCPGRMWHKYPFADVEFTTPCRRFERRDHAEPVLSGSRVLAVR